jgi:hypothetical protein
MTILIFCAGFAAGTLLICILFICIIAQAAGGTKAAREDMKETNKCVREYWRKSNEQQVLQTAALRSIGKAIDAADQTSAK